MKISGDVPPLPLRWPRVTNVRVFNHPIKVVLYKLNALRTKMRRVDVLDYFISISLMLVADVVNMRRVDVVNMRRVDVVNMSRVDVVNMRRVDVVNMRRVDVVNMRRNKT